MQPIPFIAGNKMDPLPVIGIIIAGAGFMGGAIIRDRQLIKMFRDGDSEIHRRLDTLVTSFAKESDIKALREAIDRLTSRIDNLFK